jgi:predicted nuclease of predicted toxin-antitoxin system
LKFKIDENLPQEYAEILQEAGYSADTVSDEGLSGSADPIVFATCQFEGRILITLDLDFSNLTVYPPSTHHGIIVIRSKAQDKPTLIALFRRLVPLLNQRRPDGELWIAGPEQIRFRSQTS